MNTLLRSWQFWLFAFLSWVVPFVVAIPFFSSSGEMLVAQPLFKSIMVVVGGVSGVILLALLFRRHQMDMMLAFLAGLIWMIVNLVLDAAVLVPMSGTSFGEYYADIGLRYWLQPIIAAGMGYAARLRD